MTLSSPLAVSGHATATLLTVTLGHGDATGYQSLEGLSFSVTGGTTGVLVTITGLDSAQANDGGTGGQLSFEVPANTLYTPPLPFEGLRASSTITISGTPASGQTLSVMALSHYF